MKFRAQNSKYVFKLQSPRLVMMWLRRTVRRTWLYAAPASIAPTARRPHYRQVRALRNLLKRSYILLDTPNMSLEASNSRLLLCNALPHTVLYLCNEPDNDGCWDSEDVVGTHIYAHTSHNTYVHMQNFRNWDIEYWCTGWCSSFKHTLTLFVYIK